MTSNVDERRWDNADEMVEELLAQAPMLVTHDELKQYKQFAIDFINQEVNKVLTEVFYLYGTPICESLHHPKKYQHGALEKCPVINRLEAIKKRMR